MGSTLSSNYAVEEIITQGKLSDYLIEPESMKDFKREWDLLKEKRSDNNAEIHRMVEE